MLTRSQIRWASHHDWFVADNGDGSIIVCDAYVMAGKLYEEAYTWRLTFADLRTWAGY